MTVLLSGFGEGDFSLRRFERDCMHSQLQLLVGLLLVERLHQTVAGFCNRDLLGAAAQDRDADADRIFVLGERGKAEENQKKRRKQRSGKKAAHGLTARSAASGRDNHTVADSGD